MRTKGKSGFTLVELMVVAVIVAILAAVAIPLMSGNKKRAMATEAEAALGSVRTALRAMYAETKAYNKDPNGNTISQNDPVTKIPGVTAEDLEGKYFKSTDYTIAAIGVDTYTIQAKGSTGEVAGVTITLNEKGEFTRTGL
ncbi:MAG: type II secretion system GspH family protein [Kiritimatiellae bacterium]|nr:type II secretion system GspH family protein [Kiritimatiellia bacterium]